MEYLRKGKIHHVHDNWIIKLSKKWHYFRKAEKSPVKAQMHNWKNSLQMFRGLFLKKIQTGFKTILKLLPKNVQGYLVSNGQIYSLAFFLSKIFKISGQKYRQI